MMTKMTEEEKDEHRFRKTIETVVASSQLLPSFPRARHSRLFFLLFSFSSFPCNSITFSHFRSVPFLPDTLMTVMMMMTRYNDDDDDDDDDA